MGQVADLVPGQAFWCTLSASKRHTCSPRGLDASDESFSCLHSFGTLCLHWIPAPCGSSLWHLQSLHRMLLKRLHDVLERFFNNAGLALAVSPTNLVCGMGGQGGHSRPVVGRTASAASAAEEQREKILPVLLRWSDCPSSLKTPGEWAWASCQRDLLQKTA